LATQDKPRSAPKYAALVTAFRERFEEGRYPAGSLLPTEDDLCAEFAVSRYTLREALSVLERQGYIQRRRRAGTRVLSTSPRTVFRHASGTVNELVEFIRGTKVELQPARHIETDGKLARLLGCDELREWVYLEGVRFDPATGRAIGLTWIYIDPQRAPMEGVIDFEGLPAYAWLGKHYGIHITTISQDISAVTLTAGEAEALSERMGAPSLRIVRRYFDDDQKLVMIGVTVHSSEDFVYNSRLRVD